jgi:hypothetical protein
MNEKENKKQLNPSVYTFENNEYTDTELFQLLDLNNPTDRELEAKLYSVIEKYNSIKSNIGQQLKQFYISIFNHFFETENMEDEEDNTYEENEFISNKKYHEGFEGNTVDQNEKPTYTRSLEYTKGTLNPILKETIKRVVSIDSSFRKVLTYPYTTDFTFNLSESLRDVVSLKLYSVSIPYNWYTINKNYGSNFFYINGVSNGINNGNFNYKISIPYGNYTESTLINAVNNSIQTNLIDANPDINFGTTDVSYNAVNGRCTLQMDITNNYNETNYYLYFPKITYADISDDIQDEGTFEQVTSIPQLFGYRNDTYYPFTIFSNPVFSNPVLEGVGSRYLITEENNNIKILIYSSNVLTTSELSTTSFYDPSFNYNSNVISIPIILSLPINSFATGNEILYDLSAQLQNNENLVTNYTENGNRICSTIKIINISVLSDISNGYYPTPEYIKYQLSIKPKRSLFSNGLNQKMVIEFPTESSTLPIWCNTSYTSLFNFNKKSLLDACGNIHNISDEMQNINSEITSYKTSYTVNSYPYIILKCILPNYDLFNSPFVSIQPSGSTQNIDNSYNDYLIKINSISLNSNINLNQYYSAIQTSLDNLKNFTNGQISGTFSNNLNNKPSFKFEINKTFDDYEMDISGSFLSSIFKFSQKLSNYSTYYSIIGIYTSYDIKRYTNFVKFKNNINNNTDTIDISLNGPDNIKKIINYINLAFHNNNELSKSSISYDIIDGSNFKLTLNVNIQKILKNENYKIYLLDGSSNTYDVSAINYSIYNDTNYYYGNNISWYKNLSFKDASYSLVTDVSSTDSIQSNELLLDSSNNIFQLIPIYDPSGGVYDTINPKNNILTYTLDLSNNKRYTKENIRDSINRVLITQNEGIAKGSSIDITNSITSFRVNINKTFTAKDYLIQFYNSNFNKCNFGSKSSVETVTSDTTLGWKMGFRSNIEYYLTNTNLSINSLDGTSYYGNNISNKYTYDTSGIVTLGGDTSVNVNLYNYFLIILDDYTQNHLNDGLVTTITADMDVSLPSYASRASYKCDPVSNTYGVSSTTSYDNYNQLTNAQIYSSNQLLNTNLNKYVKNTVSSGPFVQDIFGIIPMKTAGLSYGQTYTEFGGTLQIQERVYFGPVNISRMTIKLMTDKGNILDLNNQNWSFSLIAEQLYNPNK